MHDGNVATMSVLSYLNYLKPENGPFGSALGAWLDHAPSGLATRFFLLWFVILWTAFQVISYASVGLHPDLVEVYAWGLHPSAGYYKHPPLCGLLAAAWFSLFPPTDWAFHLLAMTNAAAGLFATDLIARRYLDGDKRILVLLLLLLTPFYQFHGQRFASSQTLLSTWPIATYCFLRAFETRGLAWSAGAGVAAALAMLGKYYSIFLIAGFLAAVLAHPRRWAYLRSSSPWISAAVGGGVLAPHIQWLFATEFTPFTYATALHAGASFAQVLWKDAVYVVEAVAYVGLPVAVYCIAVRPDQPTLRETIWPSDPDGRMLVVLLAVPLVLPAIVAPFIGAVLTPLWTMSAWFLLPIVLLRPKAADLTRVAAIRITALVVTTTLCTLVAAPWLAWRKHADGTQEGREYYRSVSAEITDAWHLVTGLPLRIVMGNLYLASAVTFYSPDHPDSVPGFALGPETPWVTPARLTSDGWAAICNADDNNCVDSARRRAAGRSDVQFIAYSTINRYLGNPGKLGRFFFILVAPEGSPRVLTR
jgi:4-amino-4-deoxy-L-arabinose transferase-like glycosyltransferase